VSAKRRLWIVTGVLGLIAAAMACVLPSGGSVTPTPTITPGVSAGGGTGGAGGNGGGNNGGGTGSSNGDSNNGGTGSGNNESDNNSPTKLPDIQALPYVVQQIETLGGESISGTVCSLEKPFGVLSVTPHVTFTFGFTPLDAKHGNVAYAYSIPSAGESHDASGTYTISPLDNKGTLQLSLTVSDHVVFKGFDGNIPNRYKFNLVPTAGISCP
jgi:hypothetical protein